MNKSHCFWTVKKCGYCGFVKLHIYLLKRALWHKKTEIVYLFISILDPALIRLSSVHTRWSPKPTSYNKVLHPGIRPVLHVRWSIQSCAFSRWPSLESLQWNTRWNTEGIQWKSWIRCSSRLPQNPIHGESSLHITKYLSNNTTTLVAIQLKWTSISRFNKNK